MRIRILIVHAVIAVLGELLAVLIFLLQLFTFGVADLATLLLPLTVTASSCGVSLTLCSLMSVAREYVRVPEKYRKVLGLLYSLVSTAIVILACLYTAERVLNVSMYLVVKPELHLDWMLGVSLALLLVGLVLTAYRLGLELVQTIRESLTMLTVKLRSRREKSDRSVVIIS